MRGTRRLLTIVLVIIAALCASVFPAPTARADARTDQLRARRAQLVAQLAALQPGRSSANAQLTAAEDAYNAQQAQVLSTQSQIDTLNNQLKSLDSEVQSDEVAATGARRALAQITRVTYESSQDGSMLTAIFNAHDFSTAMDSLTNAQRTTSQIQDLENTLSEKQVDLQTKRRQLQQDVAEASALQNQLQAASNKLLLLVEQRNQVAASLNGPARAIAAQIAEIDLELAGGDAPYSAPSGGSCGNHFGYGQCTWYVASRRCVPWIGNAKDWYYAAAQYGYSEGHTPVPGAIGVYWPGRGGASWVGHVVYVEAVGPADGIPAGSFRLSEMNWDAWDRVDYRVVPNDPSVFQGFIYGHP